ncbi:hypothetical protein ScPMuIL_014281 [Solemya velum]
MMEMKNQNSDKMTEKDFNLKYVDTMPEEEERTAKSCLLNNLLALLTVIGVAVGFGIGFAVRAADPSEDGIIWTGLCGEVYMRMVKMMVLPLIIASVITGTASLDPKSNGKIGATSLATIMISNVLPCVMGAILAVLINPGIGVGSYGGTSSSAEPMSTQDIFADLIRNLFPDNIVTACFQKAVTKYSKEESEVRLVNGTNVTVITKERTKSVGNSGGINLLGLIILCTLFGIAIHSIGEVARPMLLFFKGACEVILRVLRWLIWFTPIGVASLIAKVIAKTDNLEETFRKLGLYILTTTIGLVVVVFVIIVLVYVIATRKNPLKFLFSTTRSVLITFATTSTAVAMPETLQILEVGHKVDKRLTRFLVPLCAALMRGGSALYITVSCLFIIQLGGQDLSAGNVVLVVILTGLSSVAIPSVPSASVVTVIIVLTSLNISTDAVGLILAVEWLLDRMRSCTNMCLQFMCVIVVYRIHGSSMPTLVDEDKLEIDDAVRL